LKIDISQTREISCAMFCAVHAYFSRGCRAWRITWILDAHQGGKRFVVRANEKLIAFLDLEAATRALGELI
jgi:hypothetical protein